MNATIVEDESESTVTIQTAPAANADGGGDSSQPQVRYHYDVVMPTRDPDALHSGGGFRFLFPISLSSLFYVFVIRFLILNQIFEFFLRFIVFRLS